LIGLGASGLDGIAINKTVSRIAVLKAIFRSLKLRCSVINNVHRVSIYGLLSNAGSFKNTHTEMPAIVIVIQSLSQNLASTERFCPKQLALPRHDGVLEKSVLHRAVWFLKITK